MRDDPRSIGPYRTLRELGRGGQAIVWLAEDTRIQRQVALKVLPHLGPGAEPALQNLRREAEVASRLDHPGICAVLEADLDQGVPYIAMRYVAGETLSKRLATARAANAPPPDRTALRDLVHLFEKAARALHAAHEAGVIHRDVKPANIMITPEGEPVILDFGLARHDDSATHAMTITGETSGTPAYMSPEQMTGRSRPDRRTDVWSLGIALYECAALRHPFEAATREGLFQAILTQNPPDPRREGSAVDRDLATVFETATAKERDRRYQTALDFAEDLRRWRTREPIRARPVGRFEHTRRCAGTSLDLRSRSSRLSLDPDGRVIYALRRHWRDGTSAISFDPLDFLSRLAALIPRPRAHLLTYHGILAPAAQWRDLVVPRPRLKSCSPSPGLNPTCAPALTPKAHSPTRSSWSELMKRVFAIDVLVCPHCGGTRKLIALLTDGVVVRRILTHLRLSAQPPPLAPARAPIEPELAW